jgi:tetratricopeptide (TPR) repeat protein
MRYYGLYLAAKPDDHEVMTDMGTMLLTAQRIEEAINTYLRVLQADPKFFQAQFNLAIAYRSAERPDLALAALERARDLADDDQQRQRVDALLQKFGSEPSAATARESGPKEAIEAIFRSHPIVGPRLERVDWSSDNQARVILRDFPMDGMPPMVRQKFTERILSGIRQSKERLEITTNYQIEIVDAASGRVMETVSE